MSKNSTPEQRRKAGKTIVNMMAEIGVDYFPISVRNTNDGIYFMVASGSAVGGGATLDDAFIALLHAMKGTEPPPF